MNISVSRVHCVTTRSLSHYVTASRNFCMWNACVIFLAVAYNYWFCNAFRLQREEKHWGTPFCSLRPPAFVYWSLGINHCQVILKSQNNETVTEWAQIAASTYEMRLPLNEHDVKVVILICSRCAHACLCAYLSTLVYAYLFNFSARVCVLTAGARQLPYLFSRQFYPLALPRA